MLDKEEFCYGTWLGQRTNANDATSKDAQIMPSRGECASNTEQGSNGARKKYARMVLSRCVKRGAKDKYPLYKTEGCTKYAHQ